MSKLCYTTWAEVLYRNPSPAARKEKTENWTTQNLVHSRSNNDQQEKTHTKLIIFNMAFMKTGRRKKVENQAGAILKEGTVDLSYNHKQLPTPTPGFQSKGFH